MVRKGDERMDIGIVGLGRMGASMARRLARGGARVIGYDRDPAAREALAGEARLRPAENLATLAAQLEGERVVLMMLPAGEATENAIRELLPLVSAGDTLVDGGNAFYRDSMARALELSQRGLRYVDAGVSGGVHGLAHGYCLTLGGTPRSIEVFEPFAKILAPAPERGWLHCGPSGAGHFAKMIHNGIEYGMMQAFAEGFALLAARREFDFDLGRLAETWRHGSVVRSWLLDLCAGILERDAALADIAPVVADSGEGRWTALESVELGVPAPVITMALMARFASQGRADYARKLLAMMRTEFGGHPVERR
jgi:6-phosphogluconate dehydrogenase